MYYPFLKKTIKKTTLVILFSIIFSSFLFAQEQNIATGPVKPIDAGKKKKGTSLFKIEPAKNKSSNSPFNKEYEKNLSHLGEQARIYREQGVSFQRTGNLEAALSFYQKAIEMDPNYAVVYNDIGIVYEAMGYPERAEDAYLRAIELDPAYLSAYSNLALYYESKRDLDKAEKCWEKRAELGQPDDPWTQKAKQRTRDIKSLSTGIPLAQLAREEAVLGLVKDTVRQKAAYRGSNGEVFNIHFNKAKAAYAKGEETVALREAVIAKQVDPANSEINQFIEEVQKRLLAK
ncbi:MAG TPA: tetratricopeptide repeat protein [Candidatus Margulisiibacteriota bacterium]|nr:tetratricopeptide repeat protein [Candidatus Margulisiibacteriota bacterium]